MCPGTPSRASASSHACHQARCAAAATASYVLGAYTLGFASELLRPCDRPALLVELRAGIRISRIRGMTCAARTPLVWTWMVQLIVPCLRKTL